MFPRPTLPIAIAATQGVRSVSVVPIREG